MVRASWYENEPEDSAGFSSLRFRASVVNVLLAINIASFLLERLLGLGGYGTVYRSLLGLNSNLVNTPFFPLILVQLVTYQFLHGDLLHILINMLMLWFFGRELQNTLGPRKFLVLYLMSGVVGGVIQIAVGLLRGGSDFPPVVGASGAIYGIVVYYALLWPNRTVQMFVFPIVVPMKVKYLAIILVGISFLYGFLPGEGDRIAHMCHLGGAVYGFLAFRNRMFLGTSIRQKIHVHRDAKRAEKLLDDKREMDRLLEKIHREGINALTDRERKFLYETSRKLRKDD